MNPATLFYLGLPDSEHAKRNQTEIGFIPHWPRSLIGRQMQAVQTVEQPLPMSGVSSLRKGYEHGQKERSMKGPNYCLMITRATDPPKRTFTKTALRTSHPTRGSSNMPDYVSLLPKDSGSDRSKMNPATYRVSNNTVGILYHAHSQGKLKQQSFSPLKKRNPDARCVAPVGLSIFQWYAQLTALRSSQKSA
jgi:hypothetical protein